MSASATTKAPARCPFHALFGKSPSAESLAPPSHAAAAADAVQATGATSAASMQRGSVTVGVDQAPAARPTSSNAPAHSRIPCPALATLLNRGDLTPEKDGTLGTAQLDAALAGLGLSPAVRKLLVRAGDATTPAPGTLNLFGLNGSSLDHSGSTGIRQNGIHPKRFEVLKSFSKDGKRLTLQDMGRAANHYAKEDPGFTGTAIQTAELSALLLVFGSRGEKGGPSLTLADAEGLFLHGKPPVGWTPAAPNSIGLGAVAWAITKMAWYRIF